MSPRRTLAACTRGTAAVEFALVSTILIGLLVGILDFGRTLYVKNQISYLADRAARSAMVNPDISDADLEALVRDNFTAGNPDRLTFRFATDSASGETYRVMTVGFPMTLFIPQLSSKALSLSVTRRAPAG